MTRVKASTTMAKPKGKRNTQHGTPPEQTNRDHPDAPGTRVPVPGGGVAGSAPDAPGVTREQHPRQPTNRAPGAQRPGTTFSGPASMPAGEGVGGPADDRLDNEETTGSDSQPAPLSVPTGGTGAPHPGPAYGAPEADAASAGPLAEKGQEREKQFREERGL
jgi:hypothetical protein